MSSSFGAGLRFAPQQSESRVNGAEQEALIYPINVLRFRARFDTHSGRDVHRELSGAYFPRQRSLYVNEIRDTQRLGERGVTLTVLHPESVYLKANKDYYYTEDFHVGAVLRLQSNAPTPSTSMALVVTDVDKSALAYRTTECVRGRLPAGGTTGQVGGGGTEEGVGLPAAAAWSKDTLLRVGTVLFQGAEAVRKAARVCGPEDRSAPGARAAVFEVANGQEAWRLVEEMAAEGNGEVGWHEFVERACGRVPEPVHTAVVSAFKKVDYNVDHVVTLDELAGFYCAKYHPRVLAGEMAEAEVSEGMLAAFAATAKTGSSPHLVTFSQFSDYFTGLSARLEYNTFLFMMDRSWNLDNRNETPTPFR